MARLSTKIAILVICVVATQATVDVLNIPRKKLAGPATEFKDYTLPTPLDAALLEDSALIEMFFTAKDTKRESKYVFTTDLLVDSDEEFTVSILSPLAENCKVKLVSPSGVELDLSTHAFPGGFPIGLHMIPETTYRFENPEVGVYKLRVATKDTHTEQEFKSMLKSTDDADPQGYVILWNKSKTRLHSHLNTYQLRLGNKIGLITTITDDATVVKGTRPNALKDVVVTAEMEVFLPEGGEVEVQLHDDGLHDDLEAGDGVYGGSIEATETGVYRASAVITGTDATGKAFMRTTQHLIPVIVDEITLSGTASASMKDKERLNIQLDVAPDQGPIKLDRLYRGYAEVWGKDATGADVAVCWIGGLAPVEGTESQHYVTLELNLKWLSLAKATGPLTLKNIVLQETSGFLPVSEVAAIQVQIPSAILSYMSRLPFTVTEATKEMKQGARTRPLRSANSTASGDGKLVLLHGYCSGDNPWAKYPEDFTNGIYFLDSSANRNNNEFATMVYNFAEEQGASAYSVIGHSQGGMVALHLLAYFESGMDDVANGRRAQSVGTPYQGCSAAGSSASLGKIFGIGCGSNTDLATDGAKLWLAGIPEALKSEVYYYTTTYEQGNFFGDYCNMAINALLEWPNDGTSEYDYAQLPNGNNMGNTEKQCHTTDMKYDAQYYDRSRNKVMNAAAAR